MKKSLLLALAEFAIGFAVPVLAQEQNRVDPEVRQQIEAVLRKAEEAYNTYDAAAFAATYTQDAIEVWSWASEGAASGQQAIEKRCESELSSQPAKQSFNCSFRYIRPATTYARFRNLFTIICMGRVTLWRFMFETLIPGRFALPMPIDRLRFTTFDGGRHNENALTTYPCRFGNRLCCANYRDLCAREEHNPATSTSADRSCIYAVSGGI